MFDKGVAGAAGGAGSGAVAGAGSGAANGLTRWPIGAPIEDPDGAADSYVGIEPVEGASSRSVDGPVGTTTASRPTVLDATSTDHASSGRLSGLGPSDIAAMRRVLEHLDPTIEIPADHPGAVPGSGQPPDPDPGPAPGPGQTTDAAGPSESAGPAAGSAASDLAGAGSSAPHADPETGGHGLTQAQCVDLLRELEDLKAAAAGAQVAVTAHLSQARRDAEQAAGVPAAKRGKGLASEVALARRVSPHRGGQSLGLATTLAADMPCALAALRRGALSEWRATLLVRESICLDAEDRRALDAELCGDPAELDGRGDRQLVAEAKKVAYRLDPHSVVRRAARAEQERCVTVRPAPDTMAYLSALLPVAKAVSAYAALTAAADTARATGDDRSRGQVMADTLVERVTGKDDDIPAAVQIQLVMTDNTLLGTGTEPAHVAGYGTAPAAWARDLVSRALEAKDAAGVWVRRLFTDRADHLIAMESGARHAPPGLAHYVTVRDGSSCRTPWCDAPIRHLDHVVDHSAGGATDEENLKGSCEQCNYAKSRPGWHSGTSRPEWHSETSRPSDDRPPEAPRAGPLVHTRTPTGHTYPSPTPKLPRAG